MTADPHRSDVAVYVHALVQDSHNIDDTFVGNSIEQHMRSGRELQVSGPDLITAPPDCRVVGDSFDRALQLTNAVLGLLGVPTLRGVVPNVLEVGLRGG